MIREYIIKISDEIIEEEIAGRPQELVRCTDCKFGEPGECGCGIDCDGCWHDDDWFCADGKRR